MRPLKLKLLHDPSHIAGHLIHMVAGLWLIRFTVPP
jgi:hypothetical protein